MPQCVEQHVHVTARVPKRVRDDFAKLARAHDRTLSQEIRRMMKQRVEQESGGGGGSRTH